MLRYVVCDSLTCVDPPQVLLSCLLFSTLTCGLNFGVNYSVQVFHRGITNLALAQIRIFDVQPSSRILQFASLNFDASLSEIVITLCAGATLCLGSRADILPGTALVQFIEQEAITHVTLPPSALAALPLKNLSTLHTIIVAGETCPLDLALKWSEGRRFINAYGPTESTVCATAAEYKGSKSKLSIGRPIDNTQVYILDRYLHPVPIGVSGELYIGGVGLAKGYLNRKELTAERFIPNLFSNVPQSRLYKTGDLAKYLLDGNIEFLGRFDSQVKIRGYRIELEEIENSLKSYPTISETVVTVRDDINQNKRLIAYLVPRVNDRKENYETIKDNIQPQQISQWQSLFDGLLSKGSSQQDSTFNIAGWNSSYTGKPLPEEEMRQWVEHTIERIFALQPKRVLEIGCGTGLLLFRIAPHCQQYWGIDFSETVLSFVQQQLQRPGMEMPQVQLFRKTAEDFEGIPPHSFNVVILNSVSQHFPDVIYFQKVLAGMIQSSAIGGSLFIGDVRSLPLLELFHSSIQRYHAPETLSMKQLRQRIQTQIKRENELVIAPEFFVALKQQFPRITSVRILPKRGSFSNELTCFRYDVVLHLDQQCLETPDIYWIDWHRQKMSLPILRQILLEDHPECLGLHHINNARLQQEVEAFNMLRHADDLQTTAKLREAVQSVPDENAINPEAFWQIGEELSYDIEISWAAADPEGAYDVVCFREFPEQRYTPMQCQIHYPGEPAHFDSLTVYANHPTQGEFERKLIPRLRAYLQEKLPEYMIPSAFILLEKLPLTPNGKVDRNALPAPERSRPELDTAYVAPRSELEEQLAEIWKELLDLEQIGVHDDFFELGGDSLTATRLISHVRDVFELELSVTAMFDVHHIAGLAELIETTVAEEIEAMSEEDVLRLLEEDI